jgi:hypothetical protein
MRHKATAAGTSEDVARVKESYTGQYLRELLGRRAKATSKKQAAEWCRAISTAVTVGRLTS